MDLKNYSVTRILRYVITYGASFGVLKALYPILKQMPPYSLHIQKYIVIVCCAIYNYIRMHAHNDDIFENYGGKILR